MSSFANWSFEEPDWHTLRITKEGAPDGVARYELTVSGDLEATESFESGSTDTIDGKTTTGRIRPEGGTDELRYTGDVTDFSLDGPAAVYWDGEEVDPSAL